MGQSGSFPQQEVAPDGGNAQLEAQLLAGGKRVYYQYAISLLVVTFRRRSGVKLVRAGQSAVLKGLPYTLLTLVAGWWGIPWGPLWSIQALNINRRGGVDVTPAAYRKGSVSSAPTGNAQPVVVTGAPLDPALGLPRRKIRERSWARWGEMALGLFIAGMGAGFALGVWQLNGSEAPLIIFFLLLSPILIVHGALTIRRDPCLLLAQNGFDNRLASGAKGPVLWSEVVWMGRGKKWTHSRDVPLWIVMLKPGPRQPLSPLGAAPKKTEKVEINILGGFNAIIPEAMMAAYQEWQLSQSNQI